MKKAVLIVLALLMMFSLAGCGGNDTPNSPAQTANVPAGPADGETNTVAPTEEPQPMTINAVGDEICFGSYPYTKNGEEKEITWIVLDIQDGKALLLSKYAINARKNYDYSDVGYMNSLSSKMFSKEEKALIIDQEFEGQKSKCYAFLLDSEEVETYMPEDDKDLSKLRLAVATDYAKSEGVDIYADSINSGYYCNWCLRDGNKVGGQRGNSGKVAPASKSFQYHYGIRPAVWINIP